MNKLIFLLSGLLIIGCGSEAKEEAHVEEAPVEEVKVEESGEW